MAEVISSEHFKSGKNQIAHLSAEKQRFLCSFREKSSLFKINKHQVHQLWFFIKLPMINKASSIIYNFVS